MLKQIAELWWGHIPEIFSLVEELSVFIYANFSANLKVLLFFLKNKPNADKWKFKINMARLKSWAQNVKISYPDTNGPIVMTLIQLIYHIYCMQNSMWVLNSRSIIKTISALKIGKVAWDEWMKIFSRTSSMNEVNANHLWIAFHAKQK